MARMSWARSFSVKREWVDMKLREVLEDAVKKLSDAGIDNASFDAREIMKDVWGLDTARLLMELDRELPLDAAVAVSAFNECIDMRLRHVPLQHILGYTYFMGLRFNVTRDALIPRQDTEILCEAVLENERDRNIRLLDLCTGSGCIAVALKKLGMYSAVSATDADINALSLAIKNAAINDADVRFYLGDLFEGVRTFGEDSPKTEHPDYKTTYNTKDETISRMLSPNYHNEQFSGILEEKTVFDVIVSNPPYIKRAVIEDLDPEVRLFEPYKALDGGQDGLLFYRRIADECRDVLAEGGRVYLEIGYDQREAVTDILRQAGFADIRCVKDLSGKDRVICARRSSRC